MRCVASLTIITGFLATGMLIVVTHLATVISNNITGRPHARRITCQVGFRLSQFRCCVGAMTGITLNHGVCHKRP